MSVFTANATVEGEKVSASADVNIGDSIESAIEMYGEKCVWDLYSRGATLAVQQRIGGLIRSGSGQKEVTEKMKGFRLDERASRPKKSVEDKITGLLEGMDNDAIAQVLRNAGLVE